MAIKIPVDADIRDVQKKVEGLAKVVEKANRVKWNPIDTTAIDRGTQRVEQAFKRLYGGRSVQEVRESYIPPEPLSGRSGGRRGGGRAGGRDFGIADVGRGFTSGVGGGFQTIGNYAARGASGGASEGGGLGGGALGLLRGTAIGAAVFGALKVGQGISEGVDMARDRAQGLDTLKRQMGDVGVSFEKLKDYADRLSDGLGVNSQEFVKLEANLQRLSRTTESPQSLAEGTALGIGVSRSYGLDAGAAGNFFGGMRNVDPRQSNRELALILADTIARSGMNARADEVMQAILGFTSTASRLSLSSANAAAFGGAYSGLMSTHLPGMTSDTASNILMQANAGVTGMGAGAGEAGRAFMLSAFNRGGARMNPIQAEALAQGGLFGSRASVFGSGAIRQFVGDRGMGGLAGGPGASTSNFDAIRQQVGALGGNKWFQLEGAQRLFGMQSLSQTAALMNLPQGQGNSLMGLMQSNGLDINKFSASGISRMGSIAAAGTNQAQLSSIFADMRKSGVLNTDETRTLSAAEKTSPAQFRDALIRIASMKDQADDQGEQLRNQSASLDNIKINTGDKLLNPIIAMSDAIVAASGRGPKGNRERVINMSFDEAEQGNIDSFKGNVAAINGRHLPLSQQVALTEEQHQQLVQANQGLEAQRAQALRDAHSPYEITINNNVHVKDANGNTSTTSTRANVGPPQPSGSKSVTIGTH
jgi:hypothetical protein